MTIFVGPVDHVGRPLVCQNAPACTKALSQLTRGPGRTRHYCTDKCRFAAWARRQRERVFASAGPTK